MLTNDLHRPLGKPTLLSIADPERSFELSFLPVVIHIHPRARKGIAPRTEDPARDRQYFVDLMA